MNRSSSRTKIVTFRVSDREYTSLHEAAEQSGTRSISEFARSMVLERMRSEGPGWRSLGDDLATIVRELGELDDNLKQLSERIQRLLGTGDPTKKAPARDERVTVSR
jgi:hypothetical protein